MSVSMYRASIPVLVRGLSVLSSLIVKGEEYAKLKGLEERTLIEARLFEDMMPFSGQIQFATDTARLSGERLSGVEAPRFDPTESTFAQLRERIDRSTDYLLSLKPERLEDSASRAVTIKVDGAPKEFRGDDYLLMFGVQNFFFHVTTAYNILRHNGVPIGKADFLGSYADYP
ncbi:DUF1993 domain-containing protein [Pararobbsia alpina]|uniref:DUF1993 domain-containing protein n=1 Tax=Pararobbsia alpina TaxID=621374 RepID=UPI0039A5620F